MGAFPYYSFLSTLAIDIQIDALKKNRACLFLPFFSNYQNFDELIVFFWKNNLRLKQTFLTVRNRIKDIFNVIVHLYHYSLCPRGSPKSKISCIFAFMECQHRPSYFLTVHKIGEHPPLRHSSRYG